MKTKFYFLVILIGVVFAAGCTDSTTKTKTYNNYNISFSYPETWTIDEYGTITTSKGSGQVFVVGSIKEYADEDPSLEPTLDSVAEDLHSDIIGIQEKREITIAGVRGIEYIPPDDSAENRIDVFFAKGDIMYQIYLTSYDYQADKDGFQTIINTLKFN